MDKAGEILDAAVFVVRSNWKPFGIGAVIGIIIGIGIFE